MKLLAMANISTSKTQEQLAAENANLRAQLYEAEETLRAIRSGEVDALFVAGEGDGHLFTLKGADQSYRTLIEEMSEGALTMTAAGVILYANRRFAEMLKMPLEKVIGSKIHTWITPDSQRILQSLLRKGVDEKRREQLDLTASDGMRVPVTLSLSNLLIDEMPDSYCLVATDLTEQKRREEIIVASEKSVRELLAAAKQSHRELLSVIEDQKQAEEFLHKSKKEWEATFDSISDPLFIHDKELRLVRANRAYQQMAGMEFKDIIGRPYYEVFPRMDGPFSMCLKSQELIAGEVAEEYSCPVTNRIFKVVFYPIKDREGKYLNSIHILEDISARKAAEEKIREYSEHLEDMVGDRTRQLEASNKSLETFSYSVSHDLRAPLRTIAGFSAILMEDYSDKLDDEGKRLLKVVKNNVEKMGQLIDDILAFSRAGRKELELFEIDMEKLVREVLEELRPTFAVRNVQIEIKPLPPANGDRTALHQVLTNLISNAIKFTRQKELAIIEIGTTDDLVRDTLHEIRNTNNEVIYYVKDNGAGFDMENTGKLFGVFQRLHSAEEFEGTGIGLSIVRTFITKHGGRVWAEGKAGEGAIFYFTLPKLSGTSLTEH